jgi:hypothetical protein
METASAIVESVLNTLQDPSLDDDAVLAKMNECARWLSSRIIFPSLETTTVVKTVTTGNTIPLPVNFQRNLFSVDAGSSYSGISILNSRNQIADYCGGPAMVSKPGRVRYVAAIKPNLMYAPIPVVATDMTIGYHRSPDKITASSTIDFIPEGFEDIFKHYACWKLFNDIEQGMEGAKVDTNLYMSLCMGLREELSIEMKEGVSLPSPPIARMEQW